jgi:pyruvate kinase
MVCAIRHAAHMNRNLKQEDGMRRHRNVKIVATLGPASSDLRDDPRPVRGRGRRVPPEHEPRHHADIAKRHAIIRQVEADLGRPIGILADLQGPKLRVGVFANGRRGTGRGRQVPHGPVDRPGRRDPRAPAPPRDFRRAGTRGQLLVNDGKIRLRVDACGKDFADCTVTVGGTISNRKGVNVPDVVLPSRPCRKRTAAIWNLPANWASTGWRCPSCSAPKT